MIVYSQRRRRPRDDTQGMLQGPKDHVRKGPRREGPHGTGSLVRWRDASPLQTLRRMDGGLAMTAADPAACPLRGCQMGTCICPRPEFWQRIRALEARVKELSAMLYELRSQRDYAIAIQEDRER